MLKKLLFLVSSVSILGLTSCGCNANKPSSFTFDVVGNTYVAKNSTYTYNATREGVIDTNVTWSVDDSNLASIDTDGHLTLKASEGVINVIATSNEDKSKVAKHQVTIVGEKLDRTTFINKLTEQETSFWNAYKDRRDVFYCSPTYNKEIDFILVPGTTRVSRIDNILFKVNCDIKEKGLNVYVTDEENPSFWIDCYEGREYPTIDHIKNTLETFDKCKETYKDTFRGYIDYFTYDNEYGGENYNYAAYYLEYEYKDEKGNVINKLIYRSFTEGCIINYLEINNDIIDAYLHLNPLKK